MIDSKCKICRRLGEKLFLKGERCLSQKCAMIRKPYPPGIKSKKRKMSSSEYAKELKEKQKLKNLYNLEEKQFQRYVKEALESRGKVVDAGAVLIEKLENRLDNVIFRLGIASSRAAARQMVSHRHFIINGKTINIPGYSVKKGDKIKIKPNSVKKPIFQKLPSVLKKHSFPSWLKFDIEKFEGEVMDKPEIEETLSLTEVSTIFEFYSK